MKANTAAKRKAQTLGAVYKSLYMTPVDIFHWRLLAGIG